MSSPRVRLTSLLFAAIVFFVVGQARATVVDTFIQIAEAPGESTDIKHPGWINADTYSDTISGGTRAFGFSMVMNRAYPKLLAANSTGQILKLLTLEMRKAGGSQINFLNVKFENVRIANVSVNLVLNSLSPPIVYVSFTCDRATWTYTPQKQDGSADTPIVTTLDFRTTAAPAIVLPELPRRP